MAIRQVEINVKNGNTYNPLYPETDSVIVTYDNTQSGLIADNVQDAVDEIKQITDDAEITIGHLEARENGMIIIANDITIQPSAFASDTTYEDFGYVYKVEIPITGISDKYEAEIDFDMENTIDGLFANVNETIESGKVVLYASFVPEESISVPTVVCICKSTDVEVA